MDPLSIASIVVKLTASCLSTAKKLSAIRSDYKDAPISIVSMCSEAAVISACLSRLQMLVCEKTDLVQVLKSRTELNYALDVALTGCVILFSCLEDEIRNITPEASPTAAGAIKWKGKAKLVWNHDKLRDLLDGLRGQQIAINLLIQLVQLESIGEIKQVLGQKSHVLTESIRRTHSLKQSHPSMSFPASICSMDNRQSVSSKVPSTSGASRVNFEFDDLLVNSRVYRQAQILRKPIVRTKVIRGNSTNDSNSLDKKLLRTSGHGNRKNLAVMSPPRSQDYALMKAMIEFGLLHERDL